MINQKKFQVQFQLPMHHISNFMKVKLRSNQTRGHTSSVSASKEKRMRRTNFRGLERVDPVSPENFNFHKRNTLISCLKKLSYLADPHSLASRAEVEEHKRAMGARWGEGPPLRPGSTPGRPSSPPPPPPPWQPWWRRRRASPQATTPYLSPGQNISRQWTIEIRQV